MRQFHEVGRGRQLPWQQLRQQVTPPSELEELPGQMWPGKGTAKGLAGKACASIVAPVA